MLNVPILISIIAATVLVSGCGRNVSRSSDTKPAQVKEVISPTDRIAQAGDITVRITSQDLKWQATSQLGSDLNDYIVLSGPDLPHLELGRGQPMSFDPLSKFLLFQGVRFDGVPALYSLRLGSSSPTQLTDIEPESPQIMFDPFLEWINNYPVIRDAATGKQYQVDLEKSLVKEIL